MSGASEDLDRAFELAMRAISLDPQEIVCHRALALIQLCRRRHDEADFMPARRSRLIRTGGTRLPSWASFWPELLGGRCGGIDH